MELKLLLPAGWQIEKLTAYGTILTAVVSGKQIGCVTVDEDKRSFKLGIMRVREQGLYSGKGWKESLYRDAVKALSESLESRKSSGTESA